MRKSSIAIIATVLCSVFLLHPMVVTMAEDAEAMPWLSSETLFTTKILELPENQQPLSTGVNCTPTNFGYMQQLHGCVVDMPFGKVANGYYIDGPNGTLELRTSNGGSFIADTPHGMLTFTSSSRPYEGAVHIGNISTVPPQYKTSWGYPMQYYYSYELQPEKTIKTTSGAVKMLSQSTIALSPNGEWMVAQDADRGIVIYDTATLTGKTIAWLDEGNMYSNETGANNYAVSNDGRFVALNPNLASWGSTPKPTLRIYDTSTCVDQSQYVSNHKAGRTCQYSDVWNGVYAGISTKGITMTYPELEYPRHLRFAADNSLTFDSVCARTSSTAFKVARYSVSPKSSVLKVPIRLLAMGDSYISGEGAEHALGNNSVSHYITGTNTSNNKCHLSDLSYPFLLGARFAEEYHSVACSGAVMGDVTPENGNYYEGQVEDKIAWYNRDQDAILAEFTPGYASQSTFVNIINPNIIILSIGGNDIGFVKIVKRCVLSIAGNSCYSKRSERLSLLKTIYGKHKELTNTYQKILDESSSGTKVYVVGYPQVVNPTGSCGANVHLDDQERQFAVMLINRLNAAIKNAAESVGAIYVDTTSALTGHRLCDTDDDGVNGLTAGDDTVIPVVLQFNGLLIITHPGLGNESYHPTTLGHQLLATAIANDTEDLTKKAESPTNAEELAVVSDDPFVTLGEMDEAEARKIIFDKIVNEATLANGQSLQVLAGPGDMIAPGSSYTIVIHSREVMLANGTADERGVISAQITLPDIEPGVHSLHIYTTDTKGEPIDISQDIFIATSADDYDGDGIANTDDTLPLVNDTGVIIIPKDDTQPTDKSSEALGSEHSNDNKTPAGDQTISLSNTDKVFVSQNVSSAVIAQEIQSPTIPTYAVSDVAQSSQGQQSDPAVLGSSVTMSSSSSTENGTDLTKNTNKWIDWLIVVLSLVGIGGVVIFLSKRSKIESAKL